MAIKTLNYGKYDSVRIPYDSIFKSISDLSVGTSYGKVQYMAFFHNHPDGLALPSRADVASSAYMGKHFIETVGVHVLESFIAGQVADLRFTDTVINQAIKAQLSPLTSETFWEIRETFGKTHPEWFHLRNERGFYFLSKDGICPGVGLT